MLARHVSALPHAERQQDCGCGNEHPNRRRNLGRYHSNDNQFSRWKTFVRCGTSNRVSPVLSGTRVELKHGLDRRRDGFVELVKVGRAGVDFDSLEEVPLFAEVERLAGPDYAARAEEFDFLEGSLDVDLGVDAVVGIVGTIL